MEPRLAIKTWLAFQVTGKHVRPLLSLENVRGKRFSSETMYVVSFWGQLPKLFPIVRISLAYLYLEFAPLFLMYKVFLRFAEKVGDISSQSLWISYWLRTDKKYQGEGIII